MAATLRSVIGDTDFSVFIYGVTGVFKTEVAALFQAWFGSGFTSRQLGASFASTGMAIEAISFYAKDMLLVVDDFVPGGTRANADRQHQDAEMLFRNAGNRSGRGRLDQSGALREAKIGRATLLGTGEELPQRQSARARLIAVEVEPGDVDGAVLTECQGYASAGSYARCMSSYIAWLAGSRRAALKRDLAARALQLREHLQVMDGHRRTVSAISELQAAFEIFVEFLVSEAGISAAEAEDLRTRCWHGLLVNGEAQEEHHEQVDVSLRFISLLKSALASGNGHCGATKGVVPDSAALLGWKPAGALSSGSRETLFPGGDLIGWVEGEALYLDPIASVRVAEKMAPASEPFHCGSTTLARRLQSSGLLASTDGSRKRLPVRKVVQGTRRELLHLKLSVLLEPDQPSQSSHSDRREPGEPRFTLPPWDGWGASQKSPDPDTSTSSSPAGRSQGESCVDSNGNALRDEPAVLDAEVRNPLQVEAFATRDGGCDV